MLDTVIQQTAGSNSDTGEYVKDVFQDVSLQATNNTGLTSTALTNPSGDYFNDDDMVRFGPKLLWIKDLVEVDPTQYINNLKTWRIIWHENAPGVHGFIYGI